MAYVIGSQKGKDKAEEMKVGEKWTATDGSTWEKKSDGSVSVTHNGKTYNNAYTSSSSSGSSSGGSSKGGSSSSSNKNSQYTAPTLGTSWNANTDYQAIINKAVANGDYVTAAKAEQLRNQKIRETGSNYNTTNTYLSYLPDIGTAGQQQMANGASWQDVLAYYNARNYKASTTEGLGKFQNDEIQQEMWDYIVNALNKENQQNAINEANQWNQDYNEANPKEEYQSNYDSRIDKILNEILNRDDFSYDVMNDPLYQQYAAMYQREGDRAMRNTLAEAAASAGGMNTYATTAAMQANNYYNSQLNDKIPELFQLAYNMYLNDKESKVQDLGILQDMDATQYNRYRDTINDWYTDKNFAYNAYQNAIGQGNWQSNFDYNALVGNRNFNNGEFWKNKEWDYNDMWNNKEYTDNRADIDYERSQKEEEKAQATIEWYIQNGVSADAIPKDLIEKSGLDPTAISQMVEHKRTQDALAMSDGGSSRGGGGSSGGGSPSSSKKDGTWKDIIEEKEKEEDSGDGELKLSNPYDLGIGPVNNETILKLVESGAVILNSDGSMKWANGYGPHNFQEAINKFNNRLYPTLNPLF